MWRHCDGAAEAHRTSPPPHITRPRTSSTMQREIHCVGGREPATIGRRTGRPGGDVVRHRTSIPGRSCRSINPIPSVATAHRSPGEHRKGAEGNADEMGGGLVGIWRPFRGGTEDADGEPTAGMALSASSVCLYAVFQATGPPAAPDKKGGRWGDCCPCPVSSRHAEEQSGPSVIVRTLPCWTDILEGGRMCHRRSLDSCRTQIGHNKKSSRSDSLGTRLK